MEHDIQNQIRIAVGGLCDVACWRNNTGMLRDSRGNLVRFGLCVGSSDLIGIYKGRFFALEVKSAGGRTTPEQDRFIALVKKLGGIAAVVRSPEEAIEALTCG